MVAAAARELGPDVPDGMELARHVVEQVGHVLTQLAQHAAAGDARARTVAPRHMLDDIARRRLRKRPAGWLARLGHDRRCWRVLGLRLGEPIIEIGQHQLKLLHMAAQFSDERPNATRSARASRDRSAAISYRCSSSPARAAANSLLWGVNPVARDASIARNVATSLGSLSESTGMRTESRRPPRRFKQTCSQLSTLARPSRPPCLNRRAPVDPFGSVANYAGVSDTAPSLTAG